MPLRIEDYGMIGDLETAALVGRDGSIDWLCLPRFDSPACFAALLGTPENGRWRLQPVGAIRHVSRRYWEDTLVLELEFQAEGGTVRVTDFMPCRAIDSSEHPCLVRIVEGRSGHVDMEMELIMRLDYGHIVPWVRRIEGGLSAVAGPDALRLHTPVDLYGENFHTVSRFSVSAGQRIPFVLTWHPSHKSLPPELDPEKALEDTARWWRDWCVQCRYEGPWKEAVVRSLLTLKALTYAPTGGLVAAPTTSLPEDLKGVRNWDYRFCWLRDATFALYALMVGGYTEEAKAWREWLLRAVAGKPSQAQIMYGLAGERRLVEVELPWLPGYEGSKPVRAGNAAHRQFQLDVYGEVMDALHYARREGLQPEKYAWELQKAFIDHLEKVWREPDEGIWEVRGPRRHFTHSKVMAWVAFDRAVKAVEISGLDGPVDRWRQLREAVHDEVCREGFDSNLNSFVQYYGSTRLDASLLMMPLVGFLPADDLRMVGAVEAIHRRLLRDGFVMRYEPDPDVDGLAGDEGAFLVCTLWLADNLALQGRHQEATQIFERVLAVRNDLGLLSEEYDLGQQRLVGNFPQAFSHVGLINTARNLASRRGPAERRKEDDQSKGAAG